MLEFFNSLRAGWSTELFAREPASNLAVEPRFAKNNSHWQLALLVVCQICFSPLKSKFFAKFIQVWIIYVNLLINEPEEPETLVVTSCLRHKNLKVTDPINCITVRKVPVTEKFQFDYVQLPSQSQINRTDWVRLIFSLVLFDWLRRA